MKGEEEMKRRREKTAEKEMGCEECEGEIDRVGVEWDLGPAFGCLGRGIVRGDYRRCWVRRGF